MTSPFFYVSAVPREVDEAAAADAEPGQPSEFWLQYHQLEEGAREFLEACQAEIDAAGRDPGEYFAEMDAFRAGLADQGDAAGQ